MLEKIKSVMQSKGYAFFEGEHNINLIGVRSNNVITNEFDDTLYVVMQIYGEVMVKKFKEFTTDPGFYYTQNKLLNRRGAAIMKPGQYRGLWAVGKHRGKYPGLVQVGKVIVYRDGDKDTEIDPVNEHVGLFGINMHHGFDSSKINRNSAGCQVLSRVNDMNYVLDLCRLSARRYGNKFTYTLLEERDFPNRRKRIKTYNNASKAYTTTSKR